MLKISILLTAVFFINCHDFPEKLPLNVDNEDTTITHYEIDFEDEALGTAGFKDADYGPALVSMRWKKDPTARSIGVLETVWNGKLGVKGSILKDNINIGWSSTQPGAVAFVMDIWLPANFPKDAYVLIWMQDKTSWIWIQQPFQINSTSLKAGSWNTIFFDIKGAALANPAFNIYSEMQGGVQIYFMSGNHWQGSIYFDNYSLLQ